MTHERTAKPTGVRPTSAKPSLDPKRPYHIGVAIGVTTGAYAFSLMAASTLQIQHDRALIADREPVAAAISVLSDHHDDMTSRLDLARAAYTDGADGYSALVTRLDALHARLTAMDKTVTAIERANGALAANVPGAPGSVSRSGSGSSGASSGGTSGSKGSGPSAPRTVPAAPPPVAQPPTSGSTGASGAP
jgi:hypothetical protein